MKMFCVPVVLLFFATIIESCPDKCTCSYNLNNELTVYCSGRGLTQVPLDIPNDTYSM